MKHLKLIILLCSSLAVAQIQTPQPSPSTTLEQVVGLTEVKIEYSRPAMRARTIMGDLVPYGSLWRTGANKNTTLSFSDPVTVGGQALAAGTYALFTRPGKSLWEVFFYTETENWGTPQEWQSKSVAAVIEVPTQSLAEPEESFTISINELTNTGANIHLSWENTRVTLPLEVPTDEKTMASIKETMKGTPKAGDLYQAAVYYRESGRDLQTAKKWIGKAIEMDPGKYWMYRQQALILADLNKKEAAIKAAQSSLELAEKAGNQDYVRLNTKAIEEWSK
ncbi:DUF2911 domain-containing protein [Flavobacteriaceae bacterium]|jgi:hypothetical protein|nr:DUF2911 domain-containing protein [Flavobacteriaceae bacterium]